MSRFHSLRIKDVKRETPDAVSVEFDVPQELKDTFRFKHGQYLTFKLQLNGEEIRRSYSICSSPLENSLRIAVKEVEGGRASGYFNRKAQAGEVLEVMPPLGNFNTELSASNRKTYVAFAAGSGITPVISILKTVLESEPSSHFILYYGNREANSVIFKDELEKLQAKYSDRFKVQLLFSRQASNDLLFQGRISKEKIEAMAGLNPKIMQADEYFLCGPQQMIESASAFFQSRGVAKEKIHFELFTTAVPAEASVAAAESSGSPAPDGDTKVLVILDGEETEVTVPQGETILDAAIDAGLDVPYACTGGSCCTCRAKTLEGSADMEVNYALTDQEVEDGYILTCQSHPTTSTMTVDYDAS